MEVNQLSSCVVRQLLCQKYQIYNLTITVAVAEQMATVYDQSIRVFGNSSSCYCNNGKLAPVAVMSFNIDLLAILCWMSTNKRWVQNVACYVAKQSVYSNCRVGWWYSYCQYGYLVASLSGNTRNLALALRVDQFFLDFTQPLFVQASLSARTELP